MDDNTFFFKLMLFLLVVGTFVSLINMGSSYPGSIPPVVTVNTTAPAVPDACAGTGWADWFFCALQSIFNLLVWVIIQIVAIIASIISAIAFFSGITGFITGHTSFPFPLSIIIPVLLLFGWIYVIALLWKRFREMVW